MQGDLSNVNRQLVRPPAAACGAYTARVTALAATSGAKLDITKRGPGAQLVRAALRASACSVSLTEHAIATWPTTAPSVGVRSDAGGFVVCAPFGLADLA